MQVSDHVGTPAPSQAATAARPDGKPQGRLRRGARCPDAVLSVTPEQHKIYPRRYRCLMAVCLLGARFRMEDDVAIARKALEMTLRDSTRFRIELALAYGFAGQVGFAEEVMAGRLQANPVDEVALIIRALTLKAAGDPQWRQPLECLLATSSETHFRSLVIHAMECRSSQEPPTGER